MRSTTYSLFFNWKRFISQQYEGLFRSQLTKAPQENDRFAKRIGDKKKMDERYVWLDFVYRLMKELNKTDEDVYRMNYISCLNWLGYFKNKEEIKDKNSL